MASRAPQLTVAAPPQPPRSPPPPPLATHDQPPASLSSPPPPAASSSRNARKRTVFSVKVLLPRDTSTIILCDETTTAGDVLDKALVKLKLILGVAFERSTLCVRALDDTTTDTTATPTSSEEQLELEALLLVALPHVRTGQVVLRIGAKNNSRPRGPPTTVTAPPPADIVIVPSSLPAESPLLESSDTPVVPIKTMATPALTPAHHHRHSSSVGSGRWSQMLRSRSTTQVGDVDASAGPQFSPPVDAVGAHHFLSAGNVSTSASTSFRDLQAGIPLRPGSADDATRSASFASTAASLDSSSVASISNNNNNNDQHGSNNNNNYSNNNNQLHARHSSLGAQELQSALGRIIINTQSNGESEEAGEEKVPTTTRKNYRPSSMYGVPHSTVSAHIIDFCFQLPDDAPPLHLQMEICGDESVEKIKRQLKQHPQLPADIQLDQHRFMYADLSGDMYELFDEKQVFDTLSILPVWREHRMQFRLFVTPRPTSTPKQVQLLNKKIGNLIGYGLYRFEYLKELEVDTFRRKMIFIRRQAQADRDPVMYKLQPTLDTSPVTDCLLSSIGPSGKLQFRLHLQSADVVKTVTCRLNDTPRQIIAAFLPRNRIHLPENCDASDFVLKATGSLEYLVGDHAIINFAHVRQCLLKEHKLNFLLVSISEMDFSQPPVVEEFDPIEDSCNQGSHAQLTIEGRHEAEIRTISLWDVARNYRVQITACESLNPGAIESIYVEAGIYHGGVLLCPSLKTHQVITTSRNPRWAEWLNFDIACYNLPRTARLCVTVWGRWNARRKMRLDRDADLYPLGWVNVLLMDFKGHLKTGMRKMALWPGEKANPIGTCVAPTPLGTGAESPAIYLRLDSYAHPVIFPTQENIVNNSESIDKHRSTDVMRPVADLSVEQAQLIDRVIQSDPLARIDSDVAALLWMQRRNLLDIPEALPKVLQSVRWGYLDDVIEVKSLLQAWSPMSPESALELLDANFGDPDVRAYAVSRLDCLGDYQLLDYLLQLVQVLKYEPYLDCALARFLLRRSLKNRIIGHHLFWHLRAEMEDRAVALRFALLLEAYLRGCGHYLDDLIRQIDVQYNLAQVAAVIKRVKNPAERKDVLDKELAALQMPSSFHLSLNPKVEVGQLVLEKCKFMDSKKLPLWCVFENLDPFAQNVYVIFKSGDDLRQDMLTLQLIRIMEKLWQAEGIELCMLPYGCMSTGTGMGLIEVVLQAETVSNIQLASGGSSAAFRDQPLDEWLRKRNPNDADYEKAVQVFTLSCAGYCVATYVLGIGDRHNDNIMLTRDGHLFHIDFGHFLGNIKKKFGFKRERAPFVLTPDFVYVMGKREGKDSARFHQFTDYCTRAYLVLRRNANMFINLFAMMLSTGIPELKSAEDIYYLRDALCLGKSEREAEAEFRQLISESLRLGWSTQLNWFTHNLVHSNKN